MNMNLSKTILCDSDNKEDRSTYFYNIQKMDTNVVDEYKIYYGYSSDTKYVLMSYEQNLIKYLQENQNENVINYYGDNNGNIVFECEEIQFNILITNLDSNNLHVKVFLINLLNSFDNPFYLDFMKMIKQVKNEIIENNKLLNAF